MRLTTMLIAAWMGLAGGLAPLMAPAAESGLFSPKIIVNGMPITGYELAQRTRFLELLNAPGDAAKLAEQQLIDDRLQLAAAKAVGIEATDAGITAGMKEFAGRANMTTDQFVAALKQAGVSKQTFRDFVKAGVVWRSLVQQKFGPEVNISKTDTERALSLPAQQPELRLLLSEIILPANTPQFAQQSETLAQQLSSSIHSSADFAAAARKYSASNSAAQGGRLDWVPLANLPPQIGDMLKSMRPGQITKPIKMQQAIALFELRGVGEMPGPGPAKVSVKYAQYLIPGGQDAKAQAEAARIKARIGNCDDLYGVAKGQPEGTLTFTTQTMNKVPTDIGLQLARLDANEVSTALTKGGNLVFLMLCNRRPVEAAAPDLTQIHQQLLNQRLSGKAENYLAQLRADAFIRRP